MASRKSRDPMNVDDSTGTARRKKKALVELKEAPKGSAAKLAPPPQKTTRDKAGWVGTGSQQEKGKSDVLQRQRDQQKADIAQKRNELYAWNKLLREQAEARRQEDDVEYSGV